MGETQYQIAERFSEQQLSFQVEELLNISQAKGHNGYSESLIIQKPEPREGVLRLGRLSKVKISERIFKITEESVNLYTSASQTIKTYILLGIPIRTSMETSITIGSISESIGHSSKLYISEDMEGLETIRSSNTDPQFNIHSTALPGTEDYANQLDAAQEDINYLMKGI